MPNDLNEQQIKQKQFDHLSTPYVPRHNTLWLRTTPRDGTGNIQFLSSIFLDEFVSVRTFPCGLKKFPLSSVIFNRYLCPIQEPHGKGTGTTSVRRWGNLGTGQLHPPGDAVSGDEMDSIGLGVGLDLEFISAAGNERIEYICDLMVLLRIYISVTRW